MNDAIRTGMGPCIRVWSSEFNLLADIPGNASPLR